MEARVIWKGDLDFSAGAESSFTIPLTSHGSAGGNGESLSPMELIALGLAGCTAMDVISILEKKRERVSAFEVRFNGERSGMYPKVFTHIALEFIVTGDGIDPSAVKRAVQLSSDKYCPVHAMLKQAVAIENKITIIQADSVNKTG